MCFYTIRLNEQYSKDTIGLNRGRNLEFSFLVGIFFVNASQNNIIRTFIQSEMGSDLLFISRKLKIGKRKTGRTAEHGNLPGSFM